MVTSANANSLVCSMVPFSPPLLNAPNILCVCVCFFFKLRRAATLRVLLFFFPHLFSLAFIFSLQQRFIGGFCCCCCFHPQCHVEHSVVFNGAIQHYLCHVRAKSPTSFRCGAHTGHLVRLSVMPSRCVRLQRTGRRSVNATRESPHSLPPPPQETPPSPPPPRCVTVLSVRSAASASSAPRTCFSTAPRATACALSRRRSRHGRSSWHKTQSCGANWRDGARGSHS